VVVVGAVAAGLSATKRLQEAGHKVVCLEAADRIGGRVVTDMSVFGVPFDMGAHWLHSEEVNDFVGIGQSLGFDMYPMPLNGMTHGLEDDSVLWDEVDALEELWGKAAEAGADCSLADVFTPTTPWSTTAAMMHGLSMGRDLRDASLHDWSNGMEGQDWFCREGFGTLVARNAGQIPVQLSTPVTALTHLADRVEVQTPGGPVSARFVIVTVSLGVLRAEAIRFDPPLGTDHLKALDAITMGDYNHVALMFAPGALPVKPDAWVTYRINDVKAAAFSAISPARGCAALRPLAASRAACKRWGQRPPLIWRWRPSRAFLAAR